MFLISNLRSRTDSKYGFALGNKENLKYPVNSSDIINIALTNVMFAFAGGKGELIESPIKDNRNKVQGWAVLPIEEMDKILPRYGKKVE